MEIGLKNTSQTIVTEANTAKVMGSGNLDVFATPAMVALMENAAMNAVASDLPNGSTTVGSLMNTSHIKPSGIGTTITATAELIAVEGRKLTFHVSASDGESIIGEGEHVRFVVDIERFMEKVK